MERGQRGLVGEQSREIHRVLVEERAWRGGREDWLESRGERREHQKGW